MTQYTTHSTSTTWTTSSPAEREKNYDKAARRCPVEMIKVAANSRSTAVAGAIAGVVRERSQVSIQAIGAGAVNQAVKAVAIARGYLELDGIDIICVPAFAEVEIDGEERTAIRLSIEPRCEETE